MIQFQTVILRRINSANNHISDYTNVEKPFLEKLRQANLQVIYRDQGVPLDQAEYGQKLIK